MNHKELARRAWPMLARRAVRRRLTTYGAISRALGIHHRSARYFLEEIQQCCKANHMPKLTAIVVNKQIKRPGSGYHWAGKEQEEAHTKDLLDVYEYGTRWPLQAPPPL